MVGTLLENELEMEKQETEKLFPKNADLFRKLKTKLNKSPKIVKKRRKTEHVNRANIPRMTNPGEKEVRLNNHSSAEFGSISDSFRKQLESIEKYLINEQWFTLNNFEKGSRICYFQKEKPLYVVKKNRPIWTVLLCLYTILQFIFDYQIILALLLLISIPLWYKKPMLEINKKSTVYRATKVAEYSPKIVFEYLKLHYRQEVKFCGGRVLKNCKELSYDQEKQTKSYQMKLEAAQNSFSQIFDEEATASVKEYW